MTYQDRLHQIDATLDTARAHPHFNSVRLNMLSDAIGAHAETYADHLIARTGGKPGALNFEARTQKKNLQNGFDILYGEGITVNSLGRAMMAIDKRTIGEDQKPSLRTNNTHPKNASAGFMMLDHELVETALEELVDHQNAWRNQDVHPIVRAGVVTARLEFIRPYMDANTKIADGNTRLASSVGMALLHVEGYPVPLIGSADRETYFQAVNPMMHFNSLDPLAAIKPTQAELKMIQFYIGLTGTAVDTLANDLKKRVVDSTPHRQGRFPIGQ